MKILAISGSARAASTNTVLLKAISEIASPDYFLEVFADIAGLPVFLPDAENGPLPQTVQNFADKVRGNDGLIIPSPEYVHAIPGGLKNAVDWLVSRDEIIGKPIALLHASDRGDDMLAQLRMVLSTVSDQFKPGPFLRFDLLEFSPQEISDELSRMPNRKKVEEFLTKFSNSRA